MDCKYKTNSGKKIYFEVAMRLRQASIAPQAISAYYIFKRSAILLVDVIVCA